MSSDVKKILGFILVAILLAFLLGGAMVVCNYGNQIKIKNEQEQKTTVPKSD